MKLIVPNEQERNLLSVFEIADAFPTIVDIETVSQPRHEETVLLQRHNLFTVTLIIGDDERIYK